MFLITVDNALLKIVQSLASIDGCESYEDNAVTAETIIAVQEIVRVLCKNQISFEVQPWE